MGMMLEGRWMVPVFVYIPGAEWDEGRRKLWEEGIREDEVGIVKRDFNVEMEDKRTKWLESKEE